MQPALRFSPWRAVSLVITLVVACGSAVSCMDDPPGAADRDGDGLLDSIERRIGTSPRRADSDGDGLKDVLMAVDSPDSVLIH